MCCNCTHWLDCSHLPAPPDLHHFPRYEREARLWVDGGEAGVVLAPGDLVQLNLDSALYIGKAEGRLVTGEEEGIKCSVEETVTGGWAAGLEINTVTFKSKLSRNLRRPHLYQFGRVIIFLLQSINTTSCPFLQVAERVPWAAVASLACVAVWQMSSWPLTTMWTSSLKLPPARTLTTADPRLAQTGVVAVVAPVLVREVVSIRMSGGCCWVEVGWRRDSGCRKEGRSLGRKAEEVAGLTAVL